MPFIEVLTMVSLGWIAHQDFKERSVLWILFPLVGIFLAILNIQKVTFLYFFFYSSLNVLIVSTMLLLVWLYTRQLMKQKFLNHAFGLGDVLFLCAFAMGFPTVTFIILLVFSLLFSLIVCSVLKLFFELDTVPLAGLMGVFLIVTLLLSFHPDFPSLYII
tara:strand:- start:10233 stop:10715 length:483 start_codon:yes stop_codon:yes gene_type:complete